MQPAARLETAARPSTSAPSDGSRTLTLDPTQHDDSNDANEDNHTGSSASGSNAGVLRLRGSAMPGRGVQWQSDVVDNEFLGRKKSKICCIYHKPKAFDESSDESDCSGSSDDSDDSAGSADSRDSKAQRARATRRRRKHKHEHGHSHDHGDEGACDHAAPPAAGTGIAGSSSRTRANRGSTTVLEEPAPRPNAYERNPGGSGGGAGGAGGAKGKGRA